MQNNKWRQFLRARHRLWRWRIASWLVVVKAFAQRYRFWWLGLSHFKRHWALNVLIGIVWLAIDRLFLRPLEAATIERWGMSRRPA